MVVAGRPRKFMNKHVHRVLRMSGWAVEQELMEVEVHQSLWRLKGLCSDRSAARETAPVEPVPGESIRAILTIVSPRRAAMI